MKRGGGRRPLPLVPVVRSPGRLQMPIGARWGQRCAERARRLCRSRRLRGARHWLGAATARGEDQGPAFDWLRWPNSSHRPARPPPPARLPSATPRAPLPAPLLPAPARPAGTAGSAPSPSHPPAPHSALPPARRRPIPGPLFM